MSARPNHTVIRYFLEYANRINLNEDLQAFSVDDYTIKIHLLFGAEIYYFEVSNFEHEGVTIALYKAEGLNGKARFMIECKQYTFNRAQAIPTHKFYTLLNELNGFFK